MTPKVYRLNEVKLVCIAALAIQALWLSQSVRAMGVNQESFNSPEEAINVMVTAAEGRQSEEMHAIFGPAGRQLVSPDAVQAAESYNMFLKRLHQKIVLVTNSYDNISLLLGNDNWPFPIPLIKRDGQWLFDTDAGRQEIIARRVGMNELGAIDVLHAYVQAQREYACQDRKTNGILAYAQFLHSDPDTHNGLYWPVKPGEPLSPLGPLVAAAHVEGYHHTAQMLNKQVAPYHGYYFKILTRQGRHALGGPYDYIINGNMIAGFALIAWPAEWGNTGVMTFIVNQQGKIYEADLGSKTGHIAPRIGDFDPNPRWWSPLASGR
jgi:Protein of unknown function (DUF2950)